MIMSAHAKARWAERMADYDLEAEWRSAKPPSKRLRKILGDTGTPNAFARKADFMVSAGGIVFVTSLDRQLIITVFYVSGSKRRYKARRRVRRMEGA